jgi:hypothetical protein
MPPPRFEPPTLSIPRVFAAIVLASVALSGGFSILRPVMWGVQGRVSVMRDSVPIKAGAVLVPRAGEQSMMREAAKGSEWEVQEGATAASPGDDNDNTTPGDDHDAASADASDGGGGAGGDAGLPVDLAKLPAQFASMRATVGGCCTNKLNAEDPYSL